MLLSPSSSAFQLLIPTTYVFRFGQIRQEISPVTMGICLSTETTGQLGGFHTATKSASAVSTSHNVGNSESQSQGKGKGSDGSSSRRYFKIFIPGEFSKANTAPASLLSPSERTTATQPTTPTTPATDGFALSPMVAASSTPQLDIEELSLAQDACEYEYEYNEQQEQLEQPSKEVLNVITEEESLGAPSDEEEMHDLQLKKTREASLKTADPPQSSLSTNNPQPQIPPALVAPPKGAVPSVIAMGRSSVNPQTIAHFNRLKVQVQLDKRTKKKTSHKSKLEDRIEDVKGYRNLWSEYEEIQQQVHSDAASKGGTHHSINDSLDLKEPTTWYFDFKSLNGQIHIDDDDYDNRSQTSLSLLSEASLETQMRLYKEKRRQRQRRRKNQGLVRGMKDISDDQSIASVNSAVSRSSSVRFVRGQTDVSDYGPIKQVTNAAAEVSTMSIDIGSDDDTPKTKSRGGDDLSRGGGHEDSSFVSDLDMDNDYNVPRRRRRKNYDDSSVSTFDGALANNTSIDYDVDFQPRIHIEAAPADDYSNRIEKYGFDPAAPLSSQMDIFSDPSVQINDDETGVVRWRTFQASDSEAGRTSAARCLEDLYTKPLNAEAQNTVAVQEMESKTILFRRDGEENKENVDARCTLKSIVFTSPTHVNITATQNENLRQKERDNVGSGEAPTYEIQKSEIDESQNNFFASNPFKQMSSDQFMMMSSFPIGDHHPGEVDTPANKLFEQMTSDQFRMMSSFPIGDCHPGEVDTPANKLFEQMTSDQFRMMSSFPTSEDGHPGEVDTPVKKLFEQMTSDQFKMMSSFPIGDDLPREDDCTGKGVQEEDTEKVSEAFQKELSGRVGRKPCPLKSYDPIIQGLSTEAFLRLSSCHTGDFPTDEAINNGPSEVSLTRLGVRYAEGATNNTESREDDFGEDNSVESSLSNARSTEELQVSDCDELADSVSDQISKLLSKFRGNEI